ncbi:MAG: 50S ribosomal protein L35 [Candidatus Spechtbacteria bacterium RIFCSPLOWO2_01_FULL_46_10]|uniref:Large ribosomal subunit protein bL35 n=1 Tax=Candidatus Spechtbacteria bacterium RIFCSPLOWO2_01_FULL_46_10 TaxID=1802163 RepID=A0A1G2HFP2_9BACT|nr:MAG: 50S ribosomal protein L35 [Candidatus Spechtbacteria bacterium RIFCSPLOWO2_01_FULL_46_10]
MANKKLKTKKAVSKRFKITSTGKILRRPSHQGHFNAKQTGKERRMKRKLVPVAKSELKALRRLMPYN